MVELIINPPAINFPPNTFVTDCQPITTMFKVCNAIMYDEPNSNLLFIQDLHVASGAIVRWSEHEVLCRYRLRANIKKDGSSRPTLQVEALVLSTGTWTAVPESKKQLLSLNTSMAVKLAVVDNGHSLVLAHTGLQAHHGDGLHEVLS